MRVSGKTVLITGASSGIGAATAKAAAQRGAAHVVLWARGEEELNAVAASIETDDTKAHTWSVDLADAAAVDKASEHVLSNVGEPDILINNAGAGVWKYVDETVSGEMERMMAAPYFAAFNATRCFLPAMLKRGSGHIANVSSPAAFFPWPGATGYTAARWAMRGFAEALQADLWNTPIEVSLIVPGEVDSPYFDNNPGTHERLPAISRIYRRLSVDETAARLLDAVERGRRTAIFPFLLRVSIIAHRICPWPVEQLVWRTGFRRK